MPDNNNALHQVTFSLISKEGGPVTKRIALDEEENIVKDSSQCWVSRGLVETITIEVHKLPEFLSSVEKNQALIHGTCGYDAINIVAKDDF